MGKGSKTSDSTTSDSKTKDRTGGAPGDRDAEAGMRRIRSAMNSVLGGEACERNQVDVLRNGVEIFPAMLEAIGAAERSIDFLTFIYWRGDIAREMAGALADRAAAGVQVRVLLDAIGARLMDKGLVEQMRQSGAEVRFFRPVGRQFWRTTHRTHRKVLVCDEAVGFTGGVGIAGEWEGDARHPGEWRDTHFRIRGPAVSSLRSAFITNWVDTLGYLPPDDVTTALEPGAAGDMAIHVVRSQPSVGWTDADLAIRSLLEAACDTIRVTTAYFTPDHELCELLCRRAAEGVDVRILIPGEHIDKDFVQVVAVSQLEPLLRSPVRVWQFDPTMLHAKVLTVDGVVSMIGSANLNRRSLQHDDELALIVYDRSLAATLDGHFDEDLERSHELTADDWEHRGLSQRIREIPLRPFRRWF